MANQALLRTLIGTGLMLVIIYTDEAGTTSNTVTHNLTWNANVSTLYPPR